MSTTVVVDTDVVSYSVQEPSDRLPVPSGPNRPDADDLVYDPGGLDRWVLEAHWGETRRQRLREYLERFVVLPYDRDLCTKWAEVTVTAQACGRRIDCADAWIAATALLTSAPLITPQP